VVRAGLQDKVNEVAGNADMMLEEDESAMLAPMGLPPAPLLERSCSGTWSSAKGNGVWRQQVLPDVSSVELRSEHNACGSATADSSQVALSSSRAADAVHSSQTAWYVLCCISVCA
jgi:hypothetical protein